MTDGDDDREAQPQDAVTRPGAAANAEASVVAVPSPAPAGPLVEWKTGSEMAPLPGVLAVPRSARTRAWVAIALLLACAVVWAVAVVVVDLGAFALFDRAATGQLGMVEADAFDSQAATIAAVSVGLEVLTAIAFLAWLSRVVENVPRTGAGPTKRTPRGAIGWWFVPFANFVVPYQIVAETNRKLARATARRSLTILLAAWWVFWVLGGVIGRLLRMRRMPDDLPGLREIVGQSLAADVFVLAAAVLAVAVVARIQSMEDERIAAGDRPATNVEAAPG